MEVTCGISLHLSCCDHVNLKSLLRQGQVYSYPDHTCWLQPLSHRRSFHLAVPFSSYSCRDISAVAFLLLETSWLMAFGRADCINCVLTRVQEIGNENGPMTYMAVMFSHSLQGHEKWTSVGHEGGMDSNRVRRLVLGKRVSARGSSAAHTFPESSQPRDPLTSHASHVNVGRRSAAIAEPYLTRKPPDQDANTAGRVPLPCPDLGCLAL